MYLEDKKTLLCAIDHGFSTIKTEHFIFENGVKKLGSEATLQTNTMLYKGSWYKVGEGRLPIKDTKVEDEDYFLLTLAAIAKEMDYYNLTPYQRKCYARMYRLRLAEKKRFTYKSAYLYEQIRKMHELQEEYLVVVKYDVKSYGDLFRLKQRLQQVDEELCKAQKEMYRDRTLKKRSCKTAEDLEFFEASEGDYRERLEQIKLQKKDNRKELKAVERCLERDGSLAEAELELRIPVGDMEDLADVENDKVSKNSYWVQEVVEVENTDLDDVVGADVITEPEFEAIVDDELETEVEAFVETAVIGVEPGLQNDNIREHGEMVRLLSDKADYMRMSVAEKIRCYPFDDKGTDSAFAMVRAYFEKIGMDTSFDSVYEETKLLTDYYEKQKEEEFIQEKIEQIIGAMILLGLDAGNLAEYSADVLFEVLGFGDMEYFAGIKLFNKVIDRLGVDMDQQKRYEVFDRIYEAGMREKKVERNRNSR